MIPSTECPIHGYAPAASGACDICANKATAARLRAEERSQIATQDARRARDAALDSILGAGSAHAVGVLLALDTIRQVRRGPKDAAADMVAGDGFILPRAEVEAEAERHARAQAWEDEQT